jgi:hypothetical protein
MIRVMSNIFPEVFLWLAIISPISPIKPSNCWFIWSASKNLTSFNLPVLG